METDRNIKEFKNESEKLKPDERSRLPEEETDETLTKLNEVYAAADALSMKNAIAFRRVLAGLSVAATLVTFAFLLYDEAEQHWMILVCGVMILCLVLVNRIAGKLECHRKYLEYRVLAETARVQFYVHYSGAKIRVSDILPWPLRMNVPWVKDLMDQIMTKAVAGPKRNIRDCWIEEQKGYHIRAQEKNRREARTNDRIVKVSLVLSIVFYVFALFFEIRFAGLLNGNHVLDPEKIEWTRTILKILLGTTSAATLFTGNYFGKLSLENAADDHKRMIALYEKAEELIGSEGQTDALILRLAREELNENSNWYSYQSVNKPDISL